jgi:hypothetical protein
MHRFFLICLAGSLLTGCRANVTRNTPVPVEVRPAYPTYTPSATQPPASATPRSTASLSPFEAGYATQTQAARNASGLYDPKGDGTYLLGKQMARGEWLTDAIPLDPSSDCYVIARHADGIILQVYSGPALPISIYFDDYDYEVSFENCGTWTYLGEE